MTLLALLVGATGVISIASHIIGQEMQEMIRMFRNGNVKEAARIHRAKLPLMESLFNAPSPAPIKTALHLRGIDVGGVRMPLVRMNEQSIEELKIVAVE